MAYGQVMRDHDSDRHDWMLCSGVRSHNVVVPHWTKHGPSTWSKSESSVMANWLIAIMGSDIPHSFLV